MWGTNCAFKPKYRVAGPSGRRTQYVDIILKVPPQCKCLVLKCSSHCNTVETAYKVTGYKVNPDLR